MSKARLVITAVVVQGRSQSEVARSYGVSQGWVSRLVARYRTEGEAAFEPRSRRPLHSPQALSGDLVEAIVTLRGDLESRGLDAGASTIVWHLAERGCQVSPATVNRVLARNGLLRANPSKRPRSSYIRFEAEQPNECWQADVTHWRLSDTSEVEILTFLDDHSRAVVHISAHRRVSGKDVRDCFLAATKTHGIPASTLTDNGMIFTTRLSGGRNGRNAFESELRRLGVLQKNSRPNHPTTCGKVERFHQTLKKWLEAQPHRASSVVSLNRQLRRFVTDYNERRPHSSLRPKRPPLSAYNDRPKAIAGSRQDDRHLRVRHDRVDQSGNVSLRVHGHMIHIGIGRRLAGRQITLLVDDLEVQVIARQTGELLRELTIDPTRRYQARGVSPGRSREKPQ